MKSLTLVSGLLVALSSLGQAASNFNVFESLPEVPAGWQKGDAVPAAVKQQFRIALKQDNAYAFEQHVIDISTPDHPKYGQHMSHEELKRALRPSAEASEAVLSWLNDAGIWDVEDDGDWVVFRSTIGDAQKLMNAKFNYFTNTLDDSKAIRTLSYSVPNVVAPYLQMIQPTIRFGQLSAQRSQAFKIADVVSLPEIQLAADATMPVNATFCNTTITPACLRQLYNIGNFKANPRNGNKLGIAGYLKQYAKYADLETFLKQYTNENPAQNNFTYVSINGGGTNQSDTVDDDVEANLDVQYAIALASRTPTTYYSTGGLGPLIPDLDQPNQPGNNEPYLDFLHYLLKLPTSQLPKTLTTSYGEDEQSVPASYTNATCSLFAQLGARGVSVLFSSGDTGVGSACQTNDGKNTTRFLPTFPGACPFVTSVGGTYRVQPERAISFSSGGFSDRFARPSYQDAAVKKYLSILGPKWKGLYNPNGRGFPDVSAQAYNFSVIDAGKTIKVGGTSASSPAFAGIVALLNSVRLDANKPPLGFLNPWIYSRGHYGLNDITIGGSKGCTGVDQYSGLPTPIVPYASWNATEGWDPVTGYGTPNFPVLLALALTK